VTKIQLIAAISSVLWVAGCSNPNNATTNTPFPAKAPAAPQPSKTTPGSSQTVTPAPTPENTVALVNGQPISKKAIESWMTEISQHRGAANVSEEKVIDEMIKREVLRQEAAAQQLSKEPNNAARMENAERLALSQFAVEKFVKDSQISEEELKKEYEQRIGTAKKTEYKARHILVETEEAAKDVIKKLQKGEKFADLAKKLSKDPGSKTNGGDLGWFNPQQMVQPFANAVASLKNGELTQTPVQTQFGWHVIQLDDSREQTPPPFDAVKDQLRGMLQNQRLQQHITELMGKYKIERLQQPKPEEKPTADADLEAGTPASSTHEPAKPETKPEASDEESVQPN
jgi:peptidyl-prolyl cis-trans isomerase C